MLVSHRTGEEGEYCRTAVGISRSAHRYKASGNALRKKGEQTLVNLQRDLPRLPARHLPSGLPDLRNADINGSPARTSATPHCTPMALHGWAPCASWELSTLNDHKMPNRRPGRLDADPRNTRLQIGPQKPTNPGQDSEGPPRPPRRARGPYARVRPTATLHSSMSKELTVTTPYRVATRVEANGDRRPHGSWDHQ